MATSVYLGIGFRFCLRPAIFPPQVSRQKAAIEAKKQKAVMVTNDAEWSGDKFVQQSNDMVAN